MSERGGIPYLKTVGYRESPKLLKEPIQDTNKIITNLVIDIV